MLRFPRLGRRLGVTLAATAVVVAGGVGIAMATTSAPQSNAGAVGYGINEYGMTHSFYDGHTINFTYTHGFYCDKSVSAGSSSGCEAGANFKHAPSKQYDPLYITVPLGFTQPMNMLECPAGSVCVDHPGTIDLSRLEPALKALYPKLTASQLTAALKNAPVPGHDHFITDLNNGHREWWDVKVIGVLNQSTFNQIRQHESYSYIQSLLKAKNKNVVGPIPTNLFLYFGVDGFHYGS